MSNQIPTSFVPENRPGNPRLWSKSALVFGVVSLLMVQVAPAVLVEFSSAEGYTSGTLNGQPTGSSSWATSNANAFFTVNPSSGGSVAVDTSIGTSPVAGYQAAVDFTTGLAYTSYFDFAFTQSIASITGSSTTFLTNAYLLNPSGATVNTSVAGIGRTSGTDAYRLAFASGAVAIDGTALGINSALGDTTSDVIRMSLTIQQGATATTWTGTETLYNVTTSTVLATRTVSNLNFTTAVGDTSLYNAIGIGGNMPTSGISSLNILAYSSPVAVPEPATWALLIVGGLVWALRRRRLQA